MQVPKLLMDAREAAAYIGCSVRKFHQLRAEPNFPAPVALGQRSVRWHASKLAAYVATLPDKPERVEPPQLKRGRVYRTGIAQSKPVAA